MIRRHMTMCMALLCLALGVCLGLMWFDDKGQLKNVHWVPPAPVKVDLGRMPTVPENNSADVDRFVSILDRPLFSPSRRPAPPPPPPAPPPPPDPFASIQLLGVFSGADVAASGIVARVDGKVRRIRVNEMIGAWVVKSINDRDVTFASGDTTRVIRLVHLKAPLPTTPGTAKVGNVAPTAVPATQAAAYQQMQEEGRDRLRRRNEIRAKAGLPPLTE